MSNRVGSKFRLYLLRHANAAWPSPGCGDFDRPLDIKGQTDARTVALKAYACGYVPDEIVSSPAIRCKQTAEIFNDVFGGLATEFDADLYDGGSESYLARIMAASHGKSLLIVGHNPSIETIASTLLAELPGEIAFGYPTSVLLVLDIDLPLQEPLARKALFVDVVAPV